ncbi:Calpain-A [Blattella germanica]|nr:Calpain-A [Blattella germanica]
MFSTTRTINLSTPGNINCRTTTYTCKTTTRPTSFSTTCSTKNRDVKPGLRYVRTQSDVANHNVGSPVTQLGERGSGLRARGQVQDFYKLREQCLAEGSLFEDPEFPPEDSSIFFSKSPPRPFEWRRPMEIADNPELFVDDATRFDIQQGELGDCWLLAAVANLTLNKGLFTQIVPDDQGFGDKYAGIFHFRFWQYGRWVDVVIDDRLPTYSGQLVFLHSSEHNEFWRGVTEMYELNQPDKVPPNLYQIMLKAYERSSLMGCSIEPDPNVLEAQTPEGLIKGHAYSITRVKYFDIQTPRSSGKIPLIRVRNPWGNEAESPEWRFIPDEDKEEIGLTFENDGEFWMSYRDFISHFTRLEICNLNPDSLTEEELQRNDKRKWEMSMFEGEWVRGVTAGGCRNHLETFYHNPQYRITLDDPDEEDEDNKCTVIVALMQKNRRSQRRMGMECLTIGFAMYHLKDPDNLPKPLDMNFFKYNASIARSPTFINMREVSCRFKLPPGVYCIVPSTFDPNEEGEFILRVFSEHKNNMEENDDEVGMGEMDERVRDTADGFVPDMDTDVVNQPEPEEDKSQDKVKEFFRKIAGDDMEVDWMELKEILDYAMRNENEFSYKVVKYIEQVSMHKLLMQETNIFLFHLETKNAGFSKDVCRSMVAMMDAVFKLYDKDGSGCLSAFELRQALNSAGYRLNNHILNILAHRYGSKNGLITFDDYMMCAVRLKAMIDMFRERDPDNSNQATFTLEEWVEKTLYS